MDGSMSPLDWYQTVSAQPDFVHDAAQANAVQALDTLWHQLVDFKAKRNHFLGRSLLSPNVPQGLYFWGGVGRGKTFLMDVFYACVPYQRKRRIHFHHFMAEVHHELKRLSAEKDPLLALAERIEKSTRLLCFDEFHVSDIGDAMLLGRLLQALFERGVVFIMTSNQAPENLYLHGLQRQQFLPTIALLQQKLRIIELDGGNDYRLRAMQQQPLFFVPADSESHAAMQQMFNRLAPRAADTSSHIDIAGRSLTVLRVTQGVVWFDFSTLCQGARDQGDYLAITHQFHTVFISHIPCLDAAMAAATQRFIWLVDVLYDHHVKLVMSAACPPQHLCSDADHAAEFARTASRLIDMQSSHYLALPHQAQRVNLHE
jgi:cell division protein ZapE